MRDRCSRINFPKGQLLAMFILLCTRARRMTELVEHLVGKSVGFDLGIPSRNLPRHPQPVKSLVRHDPNTRFIEVIDHRLPVLTNPATPRIRIEEPGSASRLESLRPRAIRVSVHGPLPRHDLTRERTRHLATDADRRIRLRRIPAAAVHASILPVAPAPAVLVLPAKVEMADTPQNATWFVCFDVKMPDGASCRFYVPGNQMILFFNITVSCGTI